MKSDTRLFCLPVAPQPYGLGQCHVAELAVFDPSEIPHITLCRGLVQHIEAHVRKFVMARLKTAAISLSELYDFVSAAST